ncbi:MAG: twin-arginine translocation signal domain-containing protein [Anaerolineae bacterium]|nr:twin-arginine translocation signal domain-containing protein [Anaerolineae bacterium]
MGEKLSRRGFVKGVAVATAGAIATDCFVFLLFLDQPTLFPSTGRLST